MKKRIIGILFAAIFAFSLIPFAMADEADITEDSEVKADYTLIQGSTMQIKYSENIIAAVKQVESSDPEILLIKSVKNGLFNTIVTMTGLSAGTAMISLKGSQNQIIKEYTVEVTHDNVQTGEKLFDDTEGAKENNNGSSDLTVKHELTVTSAKASTCVEQGNSEYYTCSVCGKYFSDAQGTEEIEKDSWIIECSGHQLQKVDATACTCETDGNSEYYICTVCGACFADSEGKYEIDRSESVIEAGHRYGEWTILKQPTSTQKGSKVRTCTVCGYKDYESMDTISAEVNCPSADFTDVNKDSSDWRHAPIDYVLSKGYMSGTSSTKFSPDGILTRSQLVQVLYAMEGKPAVTVSAGFKDVISGKWYEDAVNWAASKGLVSGYADGSFGVQDTLKRQDLALIMFRYAESKGYDTSTNGDLSIFKDTGSISNYAVDAMKWAVGNSIISGSQESGGIYARPMATATRVQLAIILKAFDAKYSR